MKRKSVVRMRLSPEFDAIIAADAEVVAMPGAADIGGGDSAGWGKGLYAPVWLEAEGGVLFADMGHHRLLLWIPGEEPVLAGQCGGAVGGMAIDRHGRIIGCDWSGRRVIAQGLDGGAEVLADGFDGRSFERPAGVCPGNDGDLFFLDRKETFPPPPPDLATTGRSAIYRIRADGRVEDTGIALAAPGGMAFDARRSRLLVTETAQRQVWSYPVGADGAVKASGGTLLAMLDGEGKGAPHAIARDAGGVIFTGGPGGVWVLDRDGKALGILHLPASKVTGLSLGGGRLWITTPVGIAFVPLGAGVSGGALAAAPAILRQPLGFDQVIERHDPELDRIIAPDTAIVNYAWGEFFDDLGGGEDYLAACSLEGLIWDSRQQALLFSDIGNDRRMRLNPETGSIILNNQPTGNTNGATFDRDGNILSCEQGARRVTRTMPNGMRVTVIDRTNDGRRLNCPNDITVRADGHIYFTDPFWNFGDGRTTDIGHAATWHLAPDGTLTEFGGNWIVCNGLALSVDERTLFVNDSYNYHIRAFDLRPDGTVDGASDRVHCELKGPGEGKPDGMKLDVAGNIYCGGPGGLWVLGPTGRHLGTIVHGATQTNNLIFGGRDWRDLFFCNWLSLHSVRTLIPGVRTLDARA
ncbi:MAG: SMP-30/gluconolactonase/LRE family protein [Novosphingobium sp.]|nr:SMP-30/gluconolactonase/LRE family protein [Novosphingobium sp.]